MAALRCGDSRSRESSNNEWGRNTGKHDGKRDKVDVRDHGQASSIMTEPFGHQINRSPPTVN
jgi:hypothetical protein